MSQINYPVHKLVAKNVESIRGDCVLYQNINLEVTSGQIVRIEGENGVGKTTLLKILTGIGFASEGNVFWDEVELVKTREIYHSNLHYLGHENAIKMALTPLENLSFLQNLNNQAIHEEENRRVLKVIGLERHMNLPCFSLSEGQKRRVALCRLLLIEKPLWILDEPFTALDEKTVDYFESKIFEHIIKKGMLILTTHQPLRNKALQYHSLVLPGSEVS